MSNYANKQGGTVRPIISAFKMYLNYRLQIMVNQDKDYIFK